MLTDEEMSGCFGRKLEKGMCNIQSCARMLYLYYKLYFYCHYDYGISHKYLNIIKIMQQKVASHFELFM